MTIETGKITFAIFYLTQYIQDINSPLEKSKRSLQNLIRILHVLRLATCQVLKSHKQLIAIMLGRADPVTSF